MTPEYMELECLRQRSYPSKTPERVFAPTSYSFPPMRPPLPLRVMGKLYSLLDAPLKPSTKHLNPFAMLIFTISRLTLPITVILPTSSRRRR